MNIAILDNGTSVKVTYVDKFGFQGRDFHPEEDDLYGVFVVVDCLSVDTYDETEPVVCYRCCNRDGVVRDFMHYEVEVTTPVRQTRHAHHLGES